MEDPAVKAFKERLNSTWIGYGISPQIKANMDRIRRKLIGGGILNKEGGYGAKAAIMNAEDADIVRYYTSLAHGLLSYYRCADNLKLVKSLVMYHIKYSLMTTLRIKHRIGKAEFADRYGDPISCLDYKGRRVSFLSNIQISNLKREFLNEVKPDPFKDINRIVVRLTRSVINQSTVR